MVWALTLLGLPLALYTSTQINFSLFDLDLKGSFKVWKMVVFGTFLSYRSFFRGFDNLRPLCLLNFSVSKSFFLVFQTSLAISKIAIKLMRLLNVIANDHFVIFIY